MWPGDWASKSCTASKYSSHASKNEKVAVVVVVTVVGNNIII